MFGADAVYIGGEAFGLRAKAKNFSPEEMKEGIDFAHAHGVKVYVTANILAHNYDLEGARAYFKELKRSLQPKQRLKAKRDILDLSYLDQFSDELPQEWIDEGISIEAMKAFGIKTDEKANRIIYPVYDAEFNLIGVKGRTRFSDYKALKIRKYQNYQKIGTTDYFAGMKENYEEINKQKSAIIFEGLKSVMKMYGWGYRTAIAAETSVLNDDQIILLIKMGLKDVTMALDNDVSMIQIRKCTEKLRRYTNVYAAYDRNKILSGKKMAPVDDGKFVWEKLYDERIKL